ncbi:hypothetical protein [Haloplanus aerogenes]|uniref:Uncharacterized protein n=1 Tax=Haloplanus aerogenes TaxID=660522 RepID=A0A3M0DXR1_9EURY|nr:hypothetical protein [Haloplanus aerogenes]AZH24330.1 hypothetical protein DU502_02585 [Haloplanus aerogenes]RMB24036.1 hypothetical protein ATH50_1270 [Haloplanus aerogenes]
MVTVPASTLAQYRRFSLYNSPYDAHDHGCAIDCYPETNRGLSPVAGEVLDTRTVRAPSRSYAVDEDHLILIDTGEHVARILHVDPAVEPGDAVAVGDSLGEMVRSGFFAPWVDNHVHLGFRDPDVNPYRAAGSLTVEVAVDVRPLDWDGTGRVREVGETYVVLDDPAHPEPGTWAGLAGGPGVVLDGGCPHYDGGGILPAADGTAPVSVAGSRVGLADGRDVTWDDITLVANDRRIEGLSLFIARDADFGAKLVCPGHDFDPGDQVTVTVRRA